MEVMNNKKKKSESKYSNAGKGDKSRVDISPREWGIKWEKYLDQKTIEISRKGRYLLI
tara:strand:+ start:253 stop:426 length:174 start_codon:yes stop_codon:yes gene_type:complete